MGENRFKKYGSQPTGGVYQLPPSPEESRRAQQQAANETREAERLRLAQEAAARAASAQANQVAQQADAQRIALFKEGLMLDPSGAIVRIPGWRPPLTASDAANFRSKLNGLDATEAQLDRVQSAEAGLLKDGWFGPGWGRFPGAGTFDPESTTYDKATANLTSLVRQLTRTPGEGAMSDYDARLAAALPPARTDTPEARAEAMAGLRQLINEGRANFSDILGVPFAPPTPDDKTQFDANGRDPQNAMAQLLLDNSGEERKAAGWWPEKKAVPVSPAMQAEWTKFMAGWVANPDPAAMSGFLQQLNQKYASQGAQINAADAMARVVPEWIKVIRSGQGATIPVNIPDVMRDASWSDKMQQVGAKASVGPLSFLDSAASTLPSAALSRISPEFGEQWNAAREDQFVPALIGDVAGAIYGTGKIAGLGRGLAGRMGATGRRMLGTGGGAGYINGTTGQVARNIATDAAYGAGVTTVQGGNPLTGGAIGGTASLLGQGVGGMVGEALRGLSEKPLPKLLQSQGVPMTVGQLLGGIAKKMEDRIIGTVPIAGDLARARQIESMRGYNQAEFRDAADTIGMGPTRIGEQGLSDLRDMNASAYRNATDGANVSLDDQFRIDQRPVNEVLQRLPYAAQTSFRKAIDNTLGYAEREGALTGDNFQKLMISLKQYKADAPAAARGFVDDYRNGISSAQDVLRNQMRRGGGEHVVSGLRNADVAYTKIKVLADAVKRARNGTRSGEQGVFTPSQMIDANAAASKYGAVSSPFTKAAQSALPSSIPDSGTAGRLAVQGLLGGGAVTSAGAGYATDNTAAGLTPTAVMLLLAAGATKSGQRNLGKLLFSRPAPVRALGNWTKKTNQKGLFGAAAIPLGLEAQQ